MSFDDRTDAAGAAVSVAAVNLKLPPFWPSDPEVWIAQVGAQLSTSSISTQRTRYDHIVASLTPEHTAKVCDLNLNIPKPGTYPAHISSRATMPATTLPLKEVGRPKAYASTPGRQHHHCRQTPTLPPAATSHCAHGACLLCRQRQPGGGCSTR